MEACRPRRRAASSRRRPPRVAGRPQSRPHRRKISGGACFKVKIPPAAVPVIRSILDFYRGSPDTPPVARANAGTERARFTSTTGRGFCAMNRTLPATGPDLTETATASPQPAEAETIVVTTIETTTPKPVEALPESDAGVLEMPMAEPTPEPAAATETTTEPAVQEPASPEPVAQAAGEPETPVDNSEPAAPEPPVMTDIPAEPEPAQIAAVTAEPEPAQISAVTAEPETAGSEPVEAATLPAEPEAPAAEPEAAPETATHTTGEPALAADVAPEAAVATVTDDPILIPIIEAPPPEAPRTVFADLGLSEEVLHAIADMGYRHPTPIQEQAIPFVLMGRDVMGTAQTGTGKTAGFTLPMLDILSGSRARARMPRSLILEPTRELALQVAENFVQYGKYLKLTHALIIGGESMNDQKDILMKGVDVLIATPGRLLDMFDRGSILLSDTRILVIDEADRMLDMGFIPDVEKIVSFLPKTRQTLFFSATMGPEIRRLVNAFLTNPKEIAVSRAASVATTITEGLALVAEHDKREALRRLIRSQNVQNALIFCNRKRDVDILHKSLTKHHFDARALHGDMAQTLRFATLEKFKAGELRLLVCSDVAARGIDIGGLSHVFNFDVPIHAEDYVHRIGRTGRAGLEGKAFTIASPEDRYAVEQIEKLTGHAIPPIIVEGLDPVDWAERDGRKRRGGRKAPEAKKPVEKPVKEAKAPPKPRSSRSRAEKPVIETPSMQEELPMAAEPASRPDARREREPRRDETRRDETRRDETRRDEPRRDRDAPARRDAPVEPRWAEPRREDVRPDLRGDFRRDEPRRYRRDDDLGPSVVGFGDDVPAFMFLRTRPPLTAENRETDA